MRINHNIAALNTYRQLATNNSATLKSLEKLSSGLRINRAGDDAAGLAISEKMRGQIRGLNQAMRNAQDGISLIQTAEGALNETHAILQRMRELAVQSASDTNTITDRAEIQKEIDQLAIEITRIANNTEFNTQNLLNGGITAAGLGENTFHIGANANQYLTININAMDAKSLGVSRDTVAATVTSGDINATISGTTGDALVDGAEITITTADNIGVAASGTLDVDGETLTATASAVGDVLNGVRIVFSDDSDAEIAATWDAGSRTVTVTADWDGNQAGDGVTTPDLDAVETAINTALAGAGFDGSAITLDGDSVDIGDLVNAGTLTLSGGAEANADETIVTFSIAGGPTQQITVLDTATTVTVNNGAFQGLSFTTDDVKNASGTITIAAVKASEAKFANGEKISDAVTNAGIDVSSREAANEAITIIQKAIETVSAERSKLGAYQNRLEHTINNLGAAAENLTASESRIRDVDMAQEMMEFTKMSILSQAATAMLAQANQQPQLVLQLLG
ncbi:MAG: flagellin [Syntrophomonadaceae bacterium]|nr:flagellin [Syntrophomonadaceae bacterium]